MSHGTRVDGGMLQCVHSFQTHSDTAAAAAAADDDDDDGMMTRPVGSRRAVVSLLCRYPRLRDQPATTMTSRTPSALARKPEVVTAVLWTESRRLSCCPCDHQQARSMPR